MKVIVKQDCVDSQREHLRKNQIVELDPKKENRLIELSLVEEYDEEKHKNVPRGTNEKLEEENKALKDSLDTIETENKQLKQDVQDLVVIAKEAGKAKANTVVEGLDKYER